MSVLVLCAWCNHTIRNEPSADADTASHGICFSCFKDMGLVPTEDILSLSRDQIDKLPIGIIELDRDGIVRRYNETEARAAGLQAERVIGRHFFDEVAPCTSVREFRGAVEAMMADPEAARDELHFVFRFHSGDRLAHLVFAWDSDAGRMTILVDMLGDPADHEARCDTVWGSAKPPQVTLGK
ncbi:MAG: PAS domain-containing protein [Planctomycetota bacterium]